MSEHKLVGNTLNVVKGGVKAECCCGWESIHFSSMSASAAFMAHKEEYAAMREILEKQMRTRSHD